MIVYTQKSNCNTIFRISHVFLYLEQSSYECLNVLFFMRGNLYGADFGFLNLSHLFFNPKKKSNYYTTLFQMSLLEF
uniref:Uncharacterized protein n=1 Tax=Rhizophora mucronata TaxID=61149 RepID=A0A2P2PG59_RHIMU